MEPKEESIEPSRPLLNRPPNPVEVANRKLSRPWIQDEVKEDGDTTIPCWSAGSLKGPQGEKNTRDTLPLDELTLPTDEGTRPPRDQVWSSSSTLTRSLAVLTVAEPGTGVTATPVHQCLTDIEGEVALNRSPSNPSESKNSESSTDRFLI